MLREAIATGETVEIAFKNACRELGVDTAEAEFEILETPTKKTFGLFGGSPAKVRAYIEEITAGQRAANYLLDVLQHMGLANVDVTIHDVPEGADMVLSGDDAGFIIGHRGETLDALQYLASLVANQAGEKYFRVTLDVGNYREKRKETLESLGKKMAMKSLKTGRNNSLEPMNPYERRLIHTAVQSVEGAKSWSEGQDMNRHVVIGPVEGERYQKNRYNRGNNRPRNNQNRYQKPYEQRGGKKTGRPSSAPPPRRTQRYTDDPTAPVYGKIEKK